jgi:transposase
MCWRVPLLQAFYSVRSERQLVEQLDCNLLFRWFVGMGMDDAVWNHAVLSKNRDRLLTSEVAQQFFAAVIGQAKRFISDEHFTVAASRCVTVLGASFQVRNMAA